MTPAPVSARDSAPLDDFSVGSCRVHPAENTMRCDGELVPPEPKVMMLLVYLAQNAGSTISREQLFEAIWPGVVVSDDTLTQAATKLRKAFGDNARHPRYIQTVPKRGYRLCAAVTRARDALPSARASGRYRLRRFIVAALVLLAGAITIFISVDRRESAPPQSVPGGHIYTEHPAMGLIDVPAAVIEDFDFKPVYHVHYQETVHEMVDGLPTYQDLPAQAGGSGRQLPELAEASLASGRDAR